MKARTPMMPRLLQLALGAALFLTFLTTGPASAEEAAPPLPNGQEIARQINGNHFGKPVARVATLEIIDREARQRTRTLRIFRDFAPDSSRLAIYVIAPTDMKHTSFLSYDYFKAGREDEQWLYEPTRKKARRLAQINRRDSFLGSEFSLEDVKKVNRVEIAEYKWSTLGETSIDGRRAYLLEQIPAGPELAKHIGYGRILNTVDAERGLRMQIEYWDPKGKKLKTLRARGPVEREGIWLTEKIEVLNHQTGNRTLLRFSETKTDDPFDESVFTVREMEREAIR